MKEIAAIGCGLLLLIALLFGGLIGAAMWLAEASCDNTGAETGLSVQWLPLGGCFVKVDGDWVPYDRWIYNSGN